MARARQLSSTLVVVGVAMVVETWEERRKRRIKK
jgi:hypothetical protein